MAFPYSNQHSLPTQKLFSALLAIFITFFLNVNSSESLSFNFTNFQRGDATVMLQGDAVITSSGALGLTNPSKPTQNTGRALYATPVNLWDGSTGELASFVTSFSFVVKDYSGYKPADGLVIFLAPADSQIPESSGGGGLGISNADSGFNQFVAVEFDSYTNEYDPPFPHIGINVNSIRSLETVKWPRESGSLVKVSMVYDSHSKVLSVAATYPNGQISTIAQAINLKAVLPEKVSIGFSATTTESRETHNVHSWAFTSTMESSKKDNINLVRYG